MYLVAVAVVLVIVAEVAAVLMAVVLIATAAKSELVETIYLHCYESI